MDTLLAGFGLDGPLWLAAVAGSIFGLSLLLALIFNRLLFPVILRFTRWTPTNLDTRLVGAARLPLTNLVSKLVGVVSTQQTTVCSDWLAWWDASKAIRGALRVGVK